MSDKKDMQIQGSHMHYGAMRGLGAANGRNGSEESVGRLHADNPGKRLGQLAQSIGLDPAHAGLTSASEALAKAPGQNKSPVESIPDKPTQQSLNGEPTLGSVLADEIIRRLEAGDESALDSESNPKDSSDLRDALGQTMDWIRERFGDDTAAAAAGMVLQSTSSGVDENKLGDGLLNTLKFIDRNFGYAAGDTAIDRFNGTLNEEVNAYFDNGSNEMFHVADAPAENASVVQNLGSRILKASDTVAADSEDTGSVTEQLLDQLKGDLDDTAELQDLSSQIDAEASMAVQASYALNAYANQSAPVEPQLTSTAV